MAFSTHDQVPDSPTNVFATLNPLGEGLSGTLSDGNLKNVMGNAHNSLRGNFYISSGKWYWEVYVVSVTNSLVIGLSSIDEVIGTAFCPAKTIGLYSYDGKIYYNSTSANYDSSYGATDIIGVYLNLDDNQLSFYKNGSVLNSGTTIDLSNATYNLGTLKFTPRFDDGLGTGGGATFYVNHGQDSSFGGNKTSGSANAQDANGIGDFYYSPPTDALALCTANLPDPAIDPAVDDLPEDYMKSVLYTGNGSTQSITNVGFQPDLVWIKDRDAVKAHILSDSVRGITNYLISNSTNGETNISGGVADNLVKSVLTNGFTIGSDNAVNTASDKFVAWCFRAGGSPTADNTATSGAMTANSVAVDGTLQSSYTPSGSPTIYPKRMSVNTKAGFSIIKYTGTGTHTHSFPHGLTNVPDFVIIKSLGTNGWIVKHSSTASNNQLSLNSTGGQSPNYGAGGIADLTSPNVINFYYETNSTNVNNVNTSGTDYIAYCWHSVAGYSAFGSYTGNGSTDGPFVYTGFKPAWVMIKETTAANSWVIFDSTRDFYNKSDSSYLYPDLSLNEQTGVSGNAAGIDILSNGFKCKTINTEINATNQTFIYAAFAEQPFKYANAR